LFEFCDGEVGKLMGGGWFGWKVCHPAQQ
jgi:hypothetical protein